MITISDGTTTVELNGAFSAELEKERVRYRKATGEDIDLVTWIGTHLKQVAVNKRLAGEQRYLQEQAEQEFQEMVNEKIETRRRELIAEMEKKK